MIIKYASINNIHKLLNYEIKYSELYKKNKIKFFNFSKENLSKKNNKMWMDYKKLLDNNYTDRDTFCIESSFYNDNV